MSNSPLGHLKTTELLAPSQNSCLTPICNTNLKEIEHVVPVIAKEVAVGLKFLHENGIAHRDLKPANILLTNDHYIDVCGDELEFMYMWVRVRLAISVSPFGVMTEYVKFSFRPFEDDRVVSSLSEFLSHADLQYKFKRNRACCPCNSKRSCSWLEVSTRKWNSTQGLETGEHSFD